MSDTRSAHVSQTSRLREVGRFLRGPRFIDLPFRVLLLIIAGVGLTPDSLESADPAYLPLQVIAAVLVFGVCFFPVSAGVTGLLVFPLFALAFPDLVNPFQTVGEVAVAFVLSQLRIRMSLLLSALLFGIVLVPAALGVWGGDESIVSLTFGWLLAVVLGLIAGAVEHRIQAEIARRAELTRLHLRKLEKMRLTMALDTHDTVAHGLAAEAAILRMLGVEARINGRTDTQLTELALVNAHTQQQLRVLLSRLTDDPEGHSAIDAFEDELVRAAEMIRSATEAGGFDISITIGELPAEVPAEVLETALFSLKELATNIVKHATEPAPCSIAVDVDDSHPGGVLRLVSANPSSAIPDPAPRTLTARVQRVGGAVHLHHESGVLTIETSIPFDRQADV